MVEIREFRHVHERRALALPYWAAVRAVSASCSARNFSASSAPMQPQPGGGDRLAVDLVAYVAGGEYPGHAGRRGVRRGDDIAVGIDLQLALEQPAFRVVADGDEDAVDRQLPGPAGPDMLDPDTGDGGRIVGADDLVQDVVPDHLDLAIGEQALLQNLVGPELVAAMDHGDLRGMIGEVDRFLHRGIAAADHAHLEATEEEAVTGGTSGYPIAAELLLAGQAQPARLGAGADDDRLAEIDVAAVALAAERPGAEVDLGDNVEQHPGTDILGLLLHLLHEPRALDHIAEAGIVFHVGGDHQLPARLQALYHDRVQRRPRGVDGGGIAGRTGADDQAFAVMGIMGHGFARNSLVDDI